MRFTVTAMSGQVRDIRLSRQRIEGYRNFGTKLWNAARFCQINGCVAVPGFDPGSAKLTLNRWIRGEAVKAAREVTEGLDAAQFAEAASALYRFIWNVFCDWYLELAKPVLNGADEAAAAETRAMAAWTLEQAIKLLHPISPFITEALWDQTAPAGRQGLLIGAEWPELTPAWIDSAAESEIGWLIDVVSEVRSVRSEMNVPPGAKPPLTLVAPSPADRERLETHRESLQTLARLATVDVAEAAPPGAVIFVAGETTGALSIAEFVDLAAERARLSKALADLETVAQRFRKKLDNPEFMTKAPEAVVDENREKLAETDAARAKLSAALARLQTIG
jgi:valyl-tRNA synthetase